MSLKLIKNKIKSTIRTSKVTKAMEAVSAVKMRKAQERALQGRPYALSAVRILERVSGTGDTKRHPLMSEHTVGKTAVIVVTSDKGLAGSLNSTVLKETYTLLNSAPLDSFELICFGKKSFEHFERRGYAIPLHYVNVKDTIELDDMGEVVTHVTKLFGEKKYMKVYIVYQSFISTFEQSAVRKQILPLKPEALKEVVSGIVPKRGLFSESPRETHAPSYTVEPGEDMVFQMMFPMLIKIFVYHALLESKASEHSARMVAMKNATDKAKEVSHALTLTFNKARQAVITREVSEITGGIEAMKSSS